MPRALSLIIPHADPHRTNPHPAPAFTEIRFALLYLNTFPNMFYNVCIDTLSLTLLDIKAELKANSYAYIYTYMYTDM